jgi:tetratricopeptide (TPR) repeat protein
VGPRRRVRAADRLAQALARGEAPSDLRKLLVHGPIGNPSFEHAQTRKMARIDQAIALEAELAHGPAEREVAAIEAVIASDHAAAPLVGSEAMPEPSGSGSHTPIEARPRARGLWIAAAAISLCLGGLSTAFVGSSAPASALEHGLASIPDSPRAALIDPVDLRAQARAAELEPNEEEAIVVLDDRERRRGKGKRARRGSRRGGAPQTGELVDEAASALESGARKDAIDLYERALTANPRASAAAAGLSTAYFDEGRFDLATAWAEHAVKNDFDNPEYHVLLGDAYYRNASLDDARQQWETAAKLGSDRARNRLAKLDQG